MKKIALQINDLNDIVVLLFASWRLLLVGGILGTTFALYLAISETPKYRAVAKAFPSELLESENSNILGGLSRIPGIKGDKFSGQGISEKITIMQSRDFLWHFILEQDLLHYIYNEKWDEQKQEWIRPALSFTNRVKLRIRTWLYTLIGEDVKSQKYVRTDALVIFNRIFTVVPDPVVGIITVTVEMPNPVFASELANKFFDSLNSYVSEKDITQAKLNLNHLENELLETKLTDMRNVLLSLLEAEKKNEMLAQVKEDYAFQVVDPSVVPDYKSSPKRGLMTVLGAIAGVILLGFYQVFVYSFGPWYTIIKNRTKNIKS
ncbi:MAG: hypothetical protein HOJ34_03245 [Kordiimonadaceae bacterium]|nr:hypothetical protein [Kordiimonadaceae bacterium]MBT6328776.1 hypothetical protein [Kordiimonadaceae bacterium]